MFGFISKILCFTICNKWNKEDKMELNDVKAFYNYTEAIFNQNKNKKSSKRKKKDAEEHKGQAGNRNKRKIFFLMFHVFSH